MKVKNKKFSTNIKQDNKKEKEKTIGEIEKDILSSPKNINLLNKLIELFINHLENKNEEKLSQIIISLKNIFSYYLKDKNVKSSNELISFLNNKIELIYKIILDSISNNIDSSLAIIFNVFDELINFISDSQINSLFDELLWKLISSKEEISINIVNIFYGVFNSIIYYNYIFDNFLSILNNKKIKTKSEFINFYNYIINITDLDSFSENEEDTNINELKEKYQNIIINLINDKLLPLSIIKEFMKILNKKIVQNVNLE